MHTRNFQPQNVEAVDRIAEHIANENSNYISSLLQELANMQPFFTSTMMESISDLQPDETEDVLNLYLLVWGVVRQFPKCCHHAIIGKQFDRLKKKNLNMLRYLDQEEDNNLFEEIVHTDNANMHFHSLMEYISKYLLNQPALVKMEPDLFVRIFLDIKTFVESFEELVSAEN